MKHLLFTLLLLGSLCNAQEFKNTTKVTACRLVNSDSHGPCSIEYYAKKLKRSGHYIQAIESYNDTLAYNLLKLKSEAKAWKSEPFTCGEDSLATGKPHVTNMFVIEVNSFRDTVFTTVDNKAIYFPKEQLQYEAPEKNIQAVLTKDLTDFFRRDYASEISRWNMDSIPSSSITLNKKAFYGLTRKEFEKKVYPFDVARVDSVFLGAGKLYKTVTAFYINDMKFSFDGVGDRISEVALEYTSLSRNQPGMSTVSIDGVKIGDPEEVLCNKYDNTTLLKYWDAPLSAINNYYTYEVYIDDLEGIVRYTIRNKIIYAIHIEFRYPYGVKKKNTVAKVRK